MAKVNAFALAGFAIYDLFWRTTLGVNDVAIDAGQAYCLDATMAKRGQNVSVDFARKDHLRHLQGLVICNATALDDGLLDTHLLSQFSQLFSAAMNDADSDANLMQQSKFFRQRNQACVIFGDFAGEFDDERFAFEALDVRQRLAQKIKSQLIANFGSVGHVLWSLVSGL